MEIKIIILWIKKYYLLKEETLVIKINKKEIDWKKLKIKNIINQSKIKKDLVPQE